MKRSEREQWLNQRSKALWLTGLSGSGKSTIAQHLERKLFNEGFFVQVLDGDNIRNGINSDLGFSMDDRQENIRRIAEIASLYLKNGIITINAFITPTKALRDLAKSIIGKEDFIKIFVNAPLEVCEKRDIKGLYKKARKGEIKGFTGVDSLFEVPENPDLEIRSDRLSIQESVNKIFDFILPLIKY